jgi:hypothetical protein
VFGSDFIGDVIAKEPSGNNIYKYDAGILAAGEERARSITA